MLETDFFNQEVPAHFQIAMLRCAIEGCKAAFAETESLGNKWMFDAISDRRRLKTETLLEGLLNVPKGFTVSVKETEAKTHYTEIKSEKITITAVTRNKRVKRIEPYRYRETLANSDQMSLYEGNLTSYEHLYALLVFGGHYAAKFPSIVEFCFPTSTGEIGSGAIDLLRTYPDILSQYAPAEAAELAPTVSLEDIDTDVSVEG